MFNDLKLSTFILPLPSVVEPTQLKNTSQLSQLGSFPIKAGVKI